ncbi:hypothetical protein CF65_02119 [Aggregatibacter actinomycetemcomitans HK1651]|nr:hypothetical protein CF65_02119 [Aggregatibacter actinomycetemcomitans HK1651]
MRKMQGEGLQPGKQCSMLFGHFYFLRALKFKREMKISRPCKYP